MDTNTAAQIFQCLISGILLFGVIFQSIQIEKSYKNIYFLKKQLNEQKEINEVLNNEIKYLTKVNKTFSDGLDHFTKKHKGL